MLKIEVELRKWIKLAVNRPISLAHQETSTVKVVRVRTSEEMLEHQAVLVPDQGLEVLQQLNS